MKVNMPNIRWHEERILAQKKYAPNTFVPWQKVPAQAITANITTELNTAEVNSTEIQQTYDNLLAELNIVEHTIDEVLASLDSIPLVSYHSSERKNPTPLPTQDDITSPLINSSLLQPNTNPLSDTTEIITDDDVDCDHELVRVLKSDTHKWKILNMANIVNKSGLWGYSAFNEIKGNLHNIGATLTYMLDRLDDPRLPPLTI